MPEVHPAATVVLIRNGPEGLETLLLRRSSNLRFAAGNWVFPGGKIDREDYPGNSETIEAAARVAAVREAMEETAIEIGNSPLLYFAHWVTPEYFPRRFATWFFICECPADAQSVQVDGEEIVESRWCSPQQALTEYRQQQMDMMPPTFVTLQQLQTCRTVAEALEHFTTFAVQQFLPRLVKGEKPPVMLYQGDAGYSTLDCHIPGARHRLIHGEDGYEYQCQLEP